MDTNPEIKKNDAVWLVNEKGREYCCVNAVYDDGTARLYSAIQHSFLYAPLSEVHPAEPEAGLSDAMYLAQAVADIG